MRRLLILLLATVLVSTMLPPAVRAALGEVAPPAAAGTDPHRSTELVKKELTSVIEAQLAAFRTDDYQKAFTFASEEIRSALSVEQFQQMVKIGYPVIAKSSSSEFGLAFDTGEEAVVNVRVQSPEKKTVGYQYHLTKQAGAWRISGVSEIKSEGLVV